MQVDEAGSGGRAMNVKAGPTEESIGTLGTKSKEQQCLTFTMHHGYQDLEQEHLFSCVLSMSRFYGVYFPRRSSLDYSISLIFFFVGFETSHSDFDCGQTPDCCQGKESKPAQRTVPVWFPQSGQRKRRKVQDQNHEEASEGRMRFYQSFRASGKGSAVTAEENSAEPRDRLHLCVRHEIPQPPMHSSSLPTHSLDPSEYRSRGPPERIVPCSNS